MAENNEQNNPNNIVEEDKYRYKESSRWIFVLIRYLVCFLVAFGIGMVSLWLRDFFKGGLDKLTTLRYLADAFTFPGITFLCIGLLVLFAKQGAFVGLFYALRHVAKMIVPFLIRKDISYAEYLEIHEKRKEFRSVLCIFIVGGICVIVAVILIAVYTANGG